MDHEIVVTLSSDGRVEAQNPLIDVCRLDTVTWICQGTAAGRGLQVRFARNPSPFSSIPDSPAPDQIRGVVSQDVLGGAAFAYDIVENGRTLDWANGSNTGVIVIRIPPDR